MSKKQRKVRLLTAIIASVMLISTVLTVTLSASETTYYGESPSISDVSGSINLGTENFYDQSVMQKLPDNVKSTDDISIIVMMKTEALLDAYDKSDSKLSFTEYSLTEEAEYVRDIIKADADQLMKDLSGIDYILGESYNVVMSGFEIIIKAADFDKVCSAVSGKAGVIVGEVYETCETELVENKVNVYETGIFNSDSFQQTYGYDGSGMVVAVLDTGLDYYHSAFLDKYYVHNGDVGLTFEQVSAILANNDMAAEKREAGLTAEDVYISTKIPFGFDYADSDSDVFPLLSNHGTHVAGVIAGNRLEHIESDDYSGEFVGVAPGAQIAAMKIFSDTEETSHTSWILAALEDCVTLGVDVINMSIGTACGFSRESDKEAISGVYDKIRERGISLVVAASNSFNSAYSSDKNGNLPLTSNPDSSTVGSPSTYMGALSVASIEGVKTPYMTYNGSIVYFIESNDRFSEQKNFVNELLASSGSDSIEMEYVVVAGAGRTAADYTGIDVKGKIALIKRGYNTFEEKAALAEEMGAAAVIIYNNVSGDIRMNVGEVKIPVCSISQDDGEVLAAAGSGTIVISRSQTSGPFISDFSSWGPTPDLKIKPEITAHGGSILSSVPGESYDRISGTSMATPNISGVTALLRQFVINKFNLDPNKDAVEITAMVNRLMMSTADITIGKNGLPYAVRKQGAGLANLTDSAATNAYIATYNDDGSIMDKSKIELGDDPSKTGVYTLNFGIVNFGTTNMSYDLSAYVLTEGVSETKTAQGETTVTEECYLLDGAIVEIISVSGGSQSGNTISVNAGQTANVSVKITLTEENKKYLNDSFENGMYVEGFIMLKNADEVQSLNVPYLAFYGDWSVSPLFDLDFYETNRDELDDSIDPLDKTLPDAFATRPIGGSTADYVSYLGSYYFEQNPANKIIAADRKYISLSNQSTENNEINSLRFIWAGMLRNAERVEIVITEDSTGEVVFSTTDYDIRKSYGDGGPIRPANIDVEFSAIEHNLKNNTRYTVTMKGYLDYENDGSESNLNNTFTFPLVTDFSAPMLTGCEFYSEYDRSSKTNRLYAKVAIYDNHYSMAMLAGYVGLNENGELDLHAFSKYATPIYSEFNSTSYVEIELTDYIDDIVKGSYNKNTFTIACYDYAMNTSTFEIALPDDFQAFGFTDDEGGITKELHITLSPNEVYSLAPVVYPATEWGEVITYTNTFNSKAVNVVNNKIVAVQSGGATITARSPDGQTAKIYVTVLSEGDHGYTEYSKPVADSFTLTGYKVNRAFYMMDSSAREIGVEGDERKFSGSYYALKMYPSESVTLRYDLLAYFPNATYVEFSSGNDKIATVDQSGCITAIDEGIVSITAKVMMDGKSTLYSATVTVNVQEPFVTSGPSLSHYYGAGDSSGHVIFPSTLAITEIGSFAFSNYDYVAKDPTVDEISDEAPETMKMWFMGDSKVTRVTIPEGVTRIGAYAFAGITSLEQIDLPSTLEQIDYGAFYGCTNLKVVTGLENVKFINQSAFQGCSITGEISLDNVVAIANFAFSENIAITSVVLPETLQSLGAYAFGANDNLKSVEIKADKIKLGQYAFTDCYSLESIRINTAVIPTGAFNKCTSLETVILGKDVSVIEEYAFRNTKVKSFTLEEGNTSFISCDNGKYLTNASGTELSLVAPAINVFSLDNPNITSVGVGAFSGNATLLSVNLPYVTSVGDYAFSECEKLSIFNLGTLTNIGAYAFENTGIDSFEFSDDVTIGDYAFSRSDISSIYVGDNLVIPTGAFANCTKLTTVVIGNNVTVGRYAFYNDQYHAEGTVVKRNEYNAATGSLVAKDRIIYTVVLDGSITSLTIGNNVILEEGAFYGASNLESVTIGGGAYIGNYAFYNCASLSNIDLSGVKKIGAYAFSGDIHYTYRDEYYQSVDINDKGEYTYCYYAPALVSIDLTSLESLGEGAFTLCKSLESVKLGNKLSKIPYGTFQYDDKLSSINLENVTYVGDYAFAECALTSVDLSGAAEIGLYAFCYNTELLYALLGTEGLVIGEGAFSYCESLMDITGEEKASHIGDYAFACTAISAADLSNAEYIGTHAFYKEETTDFDVVITNKVLDMGDNPFANCVIDPLTSTESESFLDKEYNTIVNTFDLNDNIKIIDGSIYRVVPNGLELICWMGGEVAVVAENTVRISAMAFAGQNITQVVLPYELKAIGHKAFYGCENLSFVSFLGYEAPVLEEEYDSSYYESMEHIPSLGQYDFQNADGSPVTFEGKGIIPFFMWNVTSLPTNFFYGANFVDYVGYVDSNVAMIRPSNGKNYDTFIMNQYFNITIDGATAADSVTLAAIEAIMKLPTNSKDITLDHKPMIEAARAAYDKIMTDEQRALVPGDVYQILTNAEARIADLEYLAGEENAPVVPPVTAEGNKTLVLNIIIGIVFVLVVIAFIVVLIVFVRIVKMNPGLRTKLSDKREKPLTPDEEKARKEEIAKYVAAARPTPAPKIPKKPINRAPDIDKVVEERRAEGKKLSLPLIIIAILVVAVIAVAIILIVGKGKNSVYDQYNEQGYTVRITFDPNGGSFKGYDSTIIDLYNPDEIGEDGIQILAPDDPRRDKSNTMTVSKAGHFLAGWYAERTLVDPNDPSKGYIYSDKWDFENRKFYLDPSEDYSADTSALTLYAAWVPFYEYEIYTVDANGKEILISTVADMTLTIPEWHEGDVTLSMDNFPVREGYTLSGVYYDKELSEKVEGEPNATGSKKTISGSWDEATGTSLTPTIKLYTTWEEGEIYNIYTVEDLQKNATSNGYYKIHADLDFEGYEWPSAFANDKFTGKIFGNGHTISNVSIVSDSRSRIHNGLFSNVDESAYIENVTFKNITHTVNIASVVSGSTFGLFVGTATDGASFKNVTVNGKIIIGNDCSDLAGKTDYSIGLVAGIGSTNGVSANVTVEKADMENTSFGIEIDGNTVLITKVTD